MNRKNMLLKPLAAWLVIAGIITIVSIFYAIFSSHTIGVIAGILLLLVFVVIASWEMTVARSVWGSQVGERDNIIRSMVICLLVRAFLIYLILDVNALGRITQFDGLNSGQQAGLILSVLSIISAIVELTVLAVAVKKKEYYQPSKEELDNAMRKVKGVTVKSVSECPKCKELVEMDWSLCPNCASKLPKFCAHCGNELKVIQDTCPKCGTEVKAPASLRVMIQSLKTSAESPAMQETRSARYARLAEAQLKGGDVEGAIESYKMAIQNTEFNRKRTNFMVKMAIVLDNSGRKDDAIQMLDASLELDPEDWAGAKKVIGQIRGGATSL